MKPNAIKNDLLAGKTVAGAMIFEFFSPGMSAILANAGCRFVLYDMEHTGLGLRNAEVAVRQRAAACRSSRWCACRAASTPGSPARSIWARAA